MNLGRLRIASKGLNRIKNVDRQSVIAEFTKATEEKKESLAEVPEDQQWSEGMYMIGQVAAMHSKVCTVRELHEEVVHGATVQLERAAKSLAASRASIELGERRRSAANQSPSSACRASFPKPVM